MAKKLTDQLALLILTIFVSSSFHGFFANATERNVIPENIMFNHVNHWYYDLFPLRVLTTNSNEVSPIWLIGYGNEEASAAFLMTTGSTDIDHCSVLIFRFMPSLQRKQIDVPSDTCDIDGDPGRVYVAWAAGRMSLLNNKDLLMPLLEQYGIRFSSNRLPDLTNTVYLDDKTWTFDVRHKSVDITDGKERHVLFQFDSGKPNVLGGFALTNGIVCGVIRMHTKTDNVACVLP